LVLAVGSALATLVLVPLANAADEAAAAAVADLTQSPNTVEIGIGTVKDADAKFGEYNGHDNDGTYGIGNFDLRGGSAYNSDGVTRWRVTGSDMGLDTRNLNAQFGEQGKFSINFGYDELVHNISDSYMTPYNGAGSSTLTLPDNWETHKLTCANGVLGNQGNTNFGGVSNATVGTKGCGNYYLSGNTSNAVTANALALTGAELADFHQVDLYTERKKYQGGLTFEISPQWQISGNASHETKKGVMALGQAFGGGTSAQVTVPSPIDYTTNQFDLALAFTGDKMFAKLAGYASIFDNKKSAVTVENPWYTNSTLAAFPNVGLFSGAPSNDFYQVNFTGGYNFTHTTKLVAYAAYSRNTQNEDLERGDTVSPTANGFTNPAFDGEVITKSFNLKLTSRPINNLNLSAGYKYDDRDNKSSSHIYEWRWTDQQTGTINEAINTPYGRRLNQFNLDADYMLKQGHAIGAGYEYSNLDRTCKGELDAITSGCINVDKLKENTVRLEYRNNVFETVSGKIGYSYGQRDASSYKRNANGATGPAINAAGAALAAGSPGLAISDIADDFLTRFNSADRTRNKVRASVDWQPKDSLDLSAGVEYLHDDFDLGKNPTIANKYGPIGTFSPLDAGLNSSESWILNLDGAWKVSEKFTLNAFYTYENKESDLNGMACTSVALASATSYCTKANYPLDKAAWSANMIDRIHTFGLGFKALPKTNVEFTGDYVRSHSESPYDLTAGGKEAYSATISNPTALITSTLPLSDKLSGVYSDSDTIKLGAKYTVDKHSAWRMNLEWQKLSSGDPTRYDGLQMGSSQATVNGSGARVNGVVVPNTKVVPVAPLMPTNESSPDYSMYVVGVSYIYSF
jgi:MtrB/PioB family decaheme-associated outer membrane protein